MPLKPAFPKFVGTISLGLLTGISYSLATSTYPALLLLPSATHASRTFAAISLEAQRHVATLAIVSFISFTDAFVISPRQARHPYLIWTALLSLAATGPDLFAMARAYLVGGPSTLRAQQKGLAQDGAEGSATGQKAQLGKASNEEEWEDVVSEKGVNGEEVERRVRTAQAREIRRGIINGLAFALSVIGLWGDAA